MANQITVSSEPRQTFTVEMEERTIRFDLQWSPVRKIWAMTLSEDGEELLRGWSLLAPLNLLKGFNLGIGGLYVVVIEKDPVLDGPQQDGFAQKHALLHLTEAEVLEKETNDRPVVAGAGFP